MHSNISVSARIAPRVHSGAGVFPQHWGLTVHRPSSAEWGLWKYTAVIPVLLANGHLPLWGALLPSVNYTAVVPDGVAHHSNRSGREKTPAPTGALSR